MGPVTEPVRIMSDNGFALRLSGVTKRFGAHTAVDGLDFEVPRGVICGLLGPNGSGKTTSIRMIMGILGPDEGTVSLFGENPDVTRRTKVGYLPEERGVYKKMKCLELITFLGEIRGLKRGRGEAPRWSMAGPTGSAGVGGQEGRGSLQGDAAKDPVHRHGDP